MKNNWTKTVSAINKEKYTIPQGWDTKEQVAIDLQCAPDRVPDLLKPGIQSGLIERQDFPVWDESRRLTTRVVCYRIHPTPDQAKPVKHPPPSGDAQRDRVIRAIQRNPNAPNYLIAKNNRSTVSFVESVRNSISP